MYELEGRTIRTPIRTIRGDYKSEKGTKNRIRPWERSEFRPASSDIYRERLYCIQWMDGADIAAGKRRAATWFASVTADDLEREERVASIISENLKDWQDRGIVPDMKIEAGDETARLSRERGWTYWHHLFNARNLLTLATIRKHVPDDGYSAIHIAHQVNWNSRQCAWFRGFDTVNHAFENQSLRTLYDYGTRSSYVYSYLLKDRTKTVELGGGTREVKLRPASAFDGNAELFITDPPYADAVNYHEITEYFIAWLRKNPPSPFDEWTWDSRRAIAIKGDGEDFRKSMVDAYGTMARHMPDNGLQIVMFTHTSGQVWADMAQIFWGAGLQVTAAWYVATETTSELKKGGYVQGTVIMVLRKRGGDEDGFKHEIVQEVKAEVARQIESMTGLNQQLKGHGRFENLFEDADLQMAGYAAALRVLTGYRYIDGTDMANEALRPRKKNERTMVAEIVEFAVQVANEHLVPEGLPPSVWERATNEERFYLKMADIESTGAKKLDNYQNFGRAFRVADHTSLLASKKPNDARLARSTDLKQRISSSDGFAASKVRAVLYGMWEIRRDVDGDDVLEHLRGLVDGYYQSRDDLRQIADYLSRKRSGIDEDEAAAARVLAGLIRNERLG